MKNDVNVVNQNSTFDTDNNVSYYSQQANDHEMINLSKRNDDDIAINEIETKHFRHKVSAHVFDQCLQDSEIVTTILNSVLCRSKETDPQTKNAFLRSNNVDDYHSPSTLVIAKQLLEKSRITITQIDFCGPPGDKGPCDSYTVVIKSNIRRYLNENHNVTTVSEFVEECHSYKVVKGVLALNCKIANNIHKKEIKCKIKQRTNYFNFEHLKIGLLVHRS